MNDGSLVRPLARTEGLLVEEVETETVVLDTASGAVHCLAPVASAVYADCDGSTTVEQLTQRAGSRTGQAVSVEQVEAALAQLEERGLLTLPADPANAYSRRTLMRKTAVATAAAAAAPLVTSIVTPAFAQGTFVDERCPGGLCAGEARGDDYCACNNDCPCLTPGAGTCDPGKTATCQSFCLTAPYQDSCECLRCPSPNRANPNPNQPSHFNLNDFSGSSTGSATFALAKAVCPAEWFTTTARPACGNSGLCNGGCEPGKNIDGVCLRIDPQGDTSEPCPG